MDYLRRAAMAAVGRACGFVALGIACVMVGLVGDPAQMLRAGAVLTLLTALGLCARGWAAEHQDYRGTEAWLATPRVRRPPAEAAQQIMAAVMREASIRFAYFFSGISIGFGLAAIALGSIR